MLKRRRLIAHNLMADSTKSDRFPRGCFKVTPEGGPTQWFDEVARPQAEWGVDGIEVHNWWGCDATDGMMRFDQRMLAAAAGMQWLDRNPGSDRAQNDFAHQARLLQRDFDPLEFIGYVGTALYSPPMVAAAAEENIAEYRRIVNHSLLALIMGWASIGLDKITHALETDWAHRLAIELSELLDQHGRHIYVENVPLATERCWFGFNIIAQSRYYFDSPPPGRANYERDLTGECIAILQPLPTFPGEDEKLEYVVSETCRLMDLGFTVQTGEIDLLERRGVKRSDFPAAVSLDEAEAIQAKEIEQRRGSAA